MTVLRVGANDVDTADQTISFRISGGNGRGKFGIDGATGDITTAATFVQ